MHGDDRGVAGIHAPDRDGLVLDGSERVDNIIRSSLSWDVISGVARRAWARNENALSTVAEFNRKRSDGHITVPYIADEEYLTKLVKG